MEPARPPIDPLGREVRRWLAEADGRLGAINAAPSACPRADDFGHVTANASDWPSRAAPKRVESRVAVARSAPAPSERHGIFVATGWGARVRTA